MTQTGIRAEKPAPMSRSVGNIAGLAACIVAASCLRAAAETHYVSPSGLHIAPYANWAEAATNIQAAIAASESNDLVVVTNGIYVLDATVRVTNHVVLASWSGRDAVLLDGSALPAGQDAVFLQYGTLDGFTVSNAPRHGVKSEFGAIYNCLVTHARHNGIDSYTTPRLVADSTLVVTNTIVRKSATNGIYTCAVDTRISDCVIAESAGTGVSLRQNDTTGTIQVPRVSNFLIRASTVSSNRNSGIMLAFWDYSAALPNVSVRIENCLIENNAGVNGGGVADAGGSGTDRSSGVQIIRSIVRGNTASASGGGVYFSYNRLPSIRHSIIENNRANIQGGGVFMPETSNGSLNNCLVRENASTDAGGGTCFGTHINNTIINNEAGRGGGTAWGKCYDCIVYHNRSKSITYTNTYLGTFTYSCTAPLASGLGNISAPPMLSGFRNWRLVPGSPCIDAGNLWLSAGDYDLDGDPRVWGGGVDMGCDEFYLPGLGGPLTVLVESSVNRAVVGAPVSFRCNVEGKPESYVWEFSDGFVASNVFSLDRSFAGPGVYIATVTATNGDDIASDSVSVEIFPGYTNYVSPSGLHVPPFTNWVDAATNIQDAIAANIPGGVVAVDDGIYDVGGVAWNGGLTNRIAITSVLDVVSLNGPAHVQIVGAGPCGDSAARCAYVGTGARLIGFTLTNGHTRAAGDEDRDQSGAGAWCESGGIVENCEIRNNTAVQWGGGINNGEVRHSTLCANVALHGGGAHAARLTRCVLSNNVAIGEGGGAYGGTNENVLLMNNLAEFGGGAARSLLNHATAASNHAIQSGGGVYRGVVSNSILYLNSADAGWSNYFNSICRYTCTAPDPQSIGNVVADPLFVDVPNGIFRLQRDSPAVDSALATGLGVDLLGVARPLPGTPGSLAAPDMGAYEHTTAHYVAPGGGHVPPFATWTDAANDLQSAIDDADPLDVVFVSNGVYGAGGRVRHGGLTNRVVVDKPIRLEAVQGHADTVIEGSGPIGDAAVRGVFLGTHASLVGFTVRDGATRAAGDATFEQSGGGIWCEADAVVSNCVVSSNSANAFGGGVYGGQLVNSFVNANAAAQGGGLARGAIAFSTVTENSAENGGGVYEGTGRCSIVYFNAASGAGPNVLGGAWEACCVTPDPGGAGHVTNDPGFLASGDYRLGPGSPCIDALPLATPAPGNDLAGVPRPLDGDANGAATFDIGAQEYVHATADTDGEGLSDSDEIHVHGTNPLLQDTDGEGQSDRVEVIAGTDPLDPGSLFAILQMATGTEGQIISWPGRANRLYTIVATDDLTGGTTNQWNYTDRPGLDGAMSFTNDLSARIQIFGVSVRLAP